MNFTLTSDGVSDSKHTSLSTSSVITVQGNDSIHVRSASPAEGALLAARAIKGSAAQYKPSRSADTNEQLDGGLIATEGLANLDRWSHSTNSSTPEKAQRRPGSSSKTAMSDDREKPWRKSNNSPSSSPRASRGQSPKSSPSRFRAPETGNKLEEYRPGRVGQRIPSSNSSRAATPTLGHVGLPRLKLPANDITASRPRVKSPLSPAVVRPLTPGTAGMSTPLSGGEPTDYFGLGIAVTRDTTPRNEESGPLSPAVHSRYSSRRPKDSNVPRNRNTLESPVGESSRSRTREKREKDKKTMLSQALEKANTAVLLDNASNFEGALNAYKDACRLLHQVMDRTSGVEDKRKLDAIRETYTNRIDELCQLAQPPVAEAEKQLPPRPTSNDSADLIPQLDALSPMSPLQHPSSLDGNVDEPIADLPAALPQQGLQPSTGNRTRDSFLTNVIREVEGDSGGGFLGPLWERSKSPLGLPLLGEHGARSKEDLNSPDAPPPLSPMRAPSPKPPPKDSAVGQPQASHAPAELEGDSKHDEAGSEEPMSWLNTIDESDSDSCASSLHEGRSGPSLRRKDLRISRHAHGISEDFDAAFDAAVEAAYEDDFEPDDGDMHGLERQVTMSSTNTLDNDDKDSRMVDDLAKDYMPNGFDFTLQSKSALPRESDSSTYTRSTWQSSNRADRTTAGTSLSTLAEDASRSIAAKQAYGSTGMANAVELEDPNATLTLPATTFERPSSSGGGQILERRSRLSGPQLKPLKIETSVSPTRRRAPSAASRRNEPASAAPDSASRNDVAPWEALDRKSEVTPWETTGRRREPAPPAPDSAGRDDVAPWEVLDRKIEVAPWEAQAGPDDVKVSRVGSLRRMQKDLYSQNPVSARSDSTMSADSGAHGDLHSPVPRFLRGQKSIASLRDPLPPGTSDGENMPSTPTSANFAMYSRRNDSTSHLSARSVPHTIGSVPPLPESAHQGGSYLFDTTLGRAIDQPLSGSPRTGKESSAPLAFEPCPDSQLLRPFWLLRAIGNTVTHPRGGYITTRLFMPREAWLTRSVKIKNMEDKIAACDLLTAALQRLAKCDTYDADAVLEEVQTFEEVMERVQTMLAKKLGGEVGVGGVGSIFKEADKVGNENAAESMKDGGSKSISGKSMLNSFKKLRGKSSITNSASITGSGSAKGEYREVSNMTTVPMTSFSGVEKRTAHRRDALREAIFEGPLRDYMAAVARVCEAAQALDQIARQVEDPGLKHSSPTHVGLEFSIRHAAEFFGFYVCRFMLSDVGTLIDKYVKRSSEWVLT